MPRVKYRCPVCDTPVLAARWESGYNYCTNPECKEVLGIRINIFEAMPGPDTNISPWELDDLASMYNEDSGE